MLRPHHLQVGQRMSYGLSADSSLSLERSCGLSGTSLLETLRGRSGITLGSVVGVLCFLIFISPLSLGKYLLPLGLSSSWFCVGLCIGYSVGKSQKRVWLHFGNYVLWVNFLCMKYRWMVIQCVWFFVSSLVRVGCPAAPYSWCMLVFLSAIRSVLGTVICVTLLPYVGVRRLRVIISWENIFSVRCTVKFPDISLHCVWITVFNYSLLTYSISYKRVWCGMSK